MRLLASTDYALRLLMLLGRQEPGRTLKVEAIAELLGGLSRNHLHKIVQELAALGLLRTMRGAAGGVGLAKEPTDINLGALVRDLETGQALVECFRSDGGDCAIDCGCRLRGMFAEARDAFFESLDRFTLADCLAGRWFAAIAKRQKEMTNA
ncbi:MAG: Rrf2 family transcriptional regulator [Methylobacteriaceae bacterium]|nr:Rrf2 family transcriptional regulator [Rhodoblastus sp.]MCC0006253.1 Rrf2 family transcriptional regulator [Methylobacteriaceae bacterium]